MPTARSEITAQVNLDMRLDGDPAGNLAVGLYGQASPASADTFRRLCAGTLTVKPSDDPASYDQSFFTRVVQGSYAVGGGLTIGGGSAELVMGESRPRFTPVTPLSNADVGAGQLSQPGLLAMRKGGGAVDFAFTLGDARRAMDREWIVVGQVMDTASMEVLARLNGLPVNRYSGKPLVRVEVARCSEAPQAPRDSGRPGAAG